MNWFTGIYIVWLFTDEATLEYLGITYYPSRCARLHLPPHYTQKQPLNGVFLAGNGVSLCPRGSAWRLCSHSGFMRGMVAELNYEVTHEHTQLICYDMLLFTG